MNGSFSLVSLYFPQREIAIPYPRKKPLLSRMGKKRLFAYASLKEGALYQNLTRSAKGGVSVAVKDELGLPVRFVGVGEGIDDLQPFDADDFAKALLG